MMTLSEVKFKQAVLLLVSKGIYPGPVQIRRILNMNPHCQTINARQMQWRAEVLKDLGWTYQFNAKKRHAWTPPPAWRGRMT